MRFFHILDDIFIGDTIMNFKIIADNLLPRLKQKLEWLHSGELELINIMVDSFNNSSNSAKKTTIGTLKIQSFGKELNPTGFVMITNPKADIEFSDQHQKYVLYSFRTTKKFIATIADKLAVNEGSLVFPTRKETKRFSEYGDLRYYLLENKIRRVPFIVDKQDKQRQVSLVELFDNPDRFFFGLRNIVTDDFAIECPFCYGDGSSAVVITLNRQEVSTKNNQVSSRLIPIELFNTLN